MLDLHNNSLFCGPCFHQRVCQGEGEGGKQTDIPQAASAAAVGT